MKVVAAVVVESDGEKRRGALVSAGECILTFNVGNVVGNVVGKCESPPPPLRSGRFISLVLRLDIVCFPPSTAALLLLLLLLGKFTGNVIDVD